MGKLVTYLILFLLALNCKYKFSTYSANTPDQDLNEASIKKIQAGEASDPTTFKIAFIADTHDYYTELDKLIDKINTRGPFSFVVICGDVTNSGLLEEYDHSRQFFNRLNYPYVVAIGNHDLLANGEIIFKKMFGASNFSFVYQDVHFVFFDNNNWENGGSVPDKAWVEQTLTAANSPRNILIAHIGPNDPKRFTSEQIQSWVDLVTTFNVSYFMNGHNHNPTEGSFGPASLITIGAPTKGSYIEMTIDPGGIQHQRINF